MPALFDAAAIRTILHSDPAWSVYALGDLQPGFFEQCAWYTVHAEAPTLILIYRGCSPPILFAMGDPGAVAAILEESGSEPVLSLQVRPGIIPVLSGRFRITASKAMWRMTVTPGTFRPVPFGDAGQLTIADLPSLERLYLDGHATSESPDFFFPAMLDQGVFFGVKENGELVAAAGTHLVAAAESVAAVGNVYTRRDRRGRGLAACVTSAVVGELRRRNIFTIGLNVFQQNPVAIRLYESLGFVKHCEFVEAVALQHRL